MSLWSQIGVLLVSGIVLTGAAGVVVRHAGALAHRLGLSSFTIGFLLLGIASSTPELFVAMQAARDGIPELSAGNLLGGSILLLSFVMGVVSLLIGRVKLDHTLRTEELWAMMAVIASPVGVLWDGKLSRADGLFLVALYLVHAVLLSRQRRKTAKQTKARLAGHAAWLAGGFAAMVVSSRFVVTAAEGIIAAIHIAPIVFGLFFLSLSTNLPELALAWESIRFKRREIAFGDFLGSSAANTLLLGLLGMATPFGGGNGRLFGALLLLGSVSVYFLWAVSSGREITRKEGIGLLVFYLLFVVYELFV